MDEDLHDIEDLFRSALEGNKDIPSAKVWNNLEKGLDQEHLKKLKAKYRALKGVVAILLGLLALSVFMVVSKNAQNQNVGNGGRQIAHSTPAATPAHRPQPSGPVGPRVSEDLQRLSGLPGKVTEPQKNLAEGNFSPKSSPQPGARTPSQNELISQGKSLQGLSVDQIKSGKIRHRNYPEIPSHASALAVKNREQKSNKTAPVWSVPQWVNNAPVQRFSQTNDLPSSNDSVVLFGSIGKIQPRVVFPTPDLTFTPFMKGKENSKALHKNHWGPAVSNSLFLTAYFSPDIAWYRLQNDYLDSQADSAAALEKEEKYEFSYSFGVLAEKYINSRFALQTGLVISNTKLTLEPKYLYAQPDNGGIVKYRINTSSGYGYVLPSFSQNPVPGDSILMYTSVHSLQYVGIPLAAIYSFKLHRLTLDLKGGITANFLTRAKIEVGLENSGNRTTETVNNLVGIKKLYFNALAGAGFDYALNKKLSLSFQPTFRIALNSIDQHATVKSFPMTFGSEAGLKVGF